MRSDAAHDDDHRRLWLPRRADAGGRLEHLRAHPRVDAYVYPPTGWRGEVMTQATLGADTVVSGDCPATTTTSDGWQHYALGAPA